MASESNNNTKQPGLSLNVTMPDGSVQNFSIGEANIRGFNTGNVNDETQFYTYKDANGNDVFTSDVADLPASIALNKETGNIEITAPKSITNSDMFKQTFDEDVLKEYSQAYKLNKDYKITVNEKNEETGEDEEKELTIPEYIERLNSSINNYMQNLRDLHATRERLRSKYGDKVDNLTDEKMRLALMSNGKSIYLPSVIFNVSSFGSKKNPFLALKNKVDENGLISLDDFSEVWTRDNFGREEMAGLLATIDGTLRASEWSEKETYTDGDGVEHKYRNSASEAAKLLAFRDYIVSKNPTSDNWQQMGDYIESFVDNAAYQTTKIFGNLANIGEAIVTGGQGQFFQEGIRSMDEAMEYFNENNALVWDAVANAQIWGTLGGMALGTIGVGKILALPGKGIKAASNALTAKRIVALLERGEEISTGARIAYGALTAAERTAYVINVAMAGISKVVNRNFFTEYLFDTIHDVILYDSVGFRDMITELNNAAKTDDKAAIALGYWIGQYADNAKWWAPMGIARAAIKTAGKTPLGKAVNILLTKFNMKRQAAAGERLQARQDKIAGGSVMRKLEAALDKAESDGNVAKANRIKRQIAIENQQVELREAKKALGDIKLEWDGIRLTEESAAEWKNAMTRIKAVENGIDLYLRGVDSTVREMLSPIKNPATGKIEFLYNELAGTNVNASQWYYKLVDMNKKYGMSIADGSLLNQDVVDYWVGSFKRDVYQSVADAGGDKSAEAAKALETINQNLETLTSRLPGEITKYIDEGIKGKVYQDFYKKLNQYGVDNKLLVKETIDSYESNPIWVENGYMPLVHDIDRGGKWISEDDKIESIVEQEMDKLKFRANPGEHFKDPEMVRQVRIRHMAQAKVNSEIWKGYSGWGSNATNITIVSGEETEFARTVGESQKALESAMSKQAAGAFSENLIANIEKTRRHKPFANVRIKRETADTLVSSLSPSDVSWYLVKSNVLKNQSASLVDGVTNKNYAEWFESQNKSVQKYLRQQYGIKDGIGSYTDLKNAIKMGGSEFEPGLQRAYLVGDATFRKSSFANEAARNLEAGQDAFYQGVVLTKIKGELRNVQNLDLDSFVDDTAASIKKMVQDYVVEVSTAPGAKAALEALFGTTDGSADAAKFLALQTLLKKDNLEKAKKGLRDQIEALRAGKGLNSDDVDLLEDKMEELLVETIKGERDGARLAARTFNAELTDSKSLLDEVSAINKRITEAEERVGTDYVMYLDDHGRKTYAQVDPAFASLFNYRYRIEKAQATALARINGLMSKAFRYGTTSVNLSSFGNQLFRDFGNAILVGGAWDTIRHNADNLVDVFGQRIVDQIKQFQPEEMKYIEEAAERTGQTLEEAAVSRELLKGAARAPSSTERTLYKTFMKEAYGKDADTVLKQAQTKLQKFVDKWNPDDLLNGKRENYLRNRVFASNLNDAMKFGYSLDQARVYAEFAMNNATTNFARQLYHMQAIADSTPYFRAAINGTKSFWRMWSLDPVGVSGRIMGGLILPAMYLTGASLGDEESRRIYMNIPEYQKKDSLVFVFNGQAVSIPIPQEISNIVAPFRQFVEYLSSNAQKNDFWELMMNDLLGFSPIDLQGFSSIDMDKMISDPTIFDRVGRGFARVFSQMAPVPVKSAYMIATGTDPYSGKSLRDSSYMYWNDETNSLEVMDYNENEFAKWFASLFGGWMSPEQAEKVVSGVLGNTGSDVLGSISKALQEWSGSDFVSGLAAGLGYLGDKATERASSPFTVNTYDYTTAVWKRAIRQLTTEKEAIQDSKEYKTLNSELSKTKDPEKRKKLLAERQTLVDEFHSRVQNTVERLSSVYHGTFDRQKFAAVVALLNFNSDVAFQSGSQYSSNLASEMFWDSKDAAVHTMERMGITGTNDMSIFGYLSTDNDGNPVMKYSSPVAIMDMENQWKNQDDIHAANIKAIISQNDLYNAHEAISKQIQSIYDSKKKLTNQDYANIEAIQINWNAQLAKTIAPYVSKMTPEAAINNATVMNALYPYVEVPGSWEKNNSGRSVSLGSRGNKKKAYYDSWIKSLFSVNDAYKGQY